MKTLIFGANGFIGRHLARHFEENLGWPVVCSDLPRDNRPKYISVDLSRADFSLLAEAGPFDLCVNCSGAADVSSSYQNPTHDFKLNVANFYNILEFIRRTNPNCRVIQISSAAVYGNPQYLPIGEGHPLSPISPYGWHKYQSEILCQQFYKLYSLPTLSLRVFSAFGPGLKKQLFWDLAKKAELDGPIKLFGTGEESRDFIFVDDLTRAIEKAALRATFQGEAVNVAGGKEISIRTAASSFLESMGWRGKLEFCGQTRQGDPLNWRADIEQLKGLGFQTQTLFDEGVQRYSKWLHEIRQ